MTQVNTDKALEAYRNTRFSLSEKRKVVWSTLAPYLQNHFFPKAERVLDVGCGYGDFINFVSAKEKLAIDMDAGFQSFLGNGIHFFEGKTTDILKTAEAASLDVVFSSNLLEHLTRAEIDAFISDTHKLLKVGGVLVLLLPNYEKCFKEYFDDYTHITPLSLKGLQDWISSKGYEIVFTHGGFMPFSVKDSIVPVRRFLVSAWLKSPWKPGGKQMLIVARKAR